MLSPLFGGCSYNCDSSVWCMWCMTVCFLVLIQCESVTADVSPIATGPHLPSQPVFWVLFLLFSFCHQRHPTVTPVACAVSDY